MTFVEKLTALRNEMKEEGLSLYYISSDDPHQSPHVAKRWQSVQWFTGFTGSVGVCIVTMSRAAFWSDGRYTLQAERELAGTGLELFTTGLPETPSIAEWILIEDSQCILGLDGRTLCMNSYRKLEQELRSGGVTISGKTDLIDRIWHDRPSIPKEPMFELPLWSAGKSPSQKLASLKERMKQNRADWYLGVALDDVAWLTNLRCFENPIHPIFHSSVLTDGTKAKVYCDTGKVTDEIRIHLAAEGFTFGDLDELTSDLKALPEGIRLYYDPCKVGFLYATALPESVRVIEGPDLLTFMKTIKNETELANLRECNDSECVALFRMYEYIRAHAADGTLDETAPATIVEEERRKNPLYLRAANAPLVAYMKNAATTHYRARQGLSTPLKAEGVLLMDLCAHYMNGSTDITRTIALGPVPEELREDYTLMLKSHIALSVQKFPQGTTGPLLDAAAKSVLWNEGRNCLHGSGHGQGYVLDIQEGPGKISVEYFALFPYMFTAPLLPGMVFSNEPGVYRRDRYGVRVENTLAVREAFSNEFGKFLEFETLTFLPYERSLIVRNMLSQKEITWIDEYHRQTYQKLAPMLSPAEQEILFEQTRPL